MLVCYLALRSDRLRSPRTPITSLGMLATLWLATWLNRSDRSVCRCLTMGKAAIRSLEQQGIDVRIVATWVCS